VGRARLFEVVVIKNDPATTTFLSCKKWAEKPGGEARRGRRALGQTNLYRRFVLYLLGGGLTRFE